MCYDVIYFPLLIILCSLHCVMKYSFTAFKLIAYQSVYLTSPLHQACRLFRLFQSFTYSGLINILVPFYLPLSHLVAQAKNLGVIFDSSFPLLILQCYLYREAFLDPSSPPSHPVPFFHPVIAIISLITLFIICHYCFYFSFSYFPFPTLYANRISYLRTCAQNGAWNICAQ